MVSSGFHPIIRESRENRCIRSSQRKLGSASEKERAASCAFAMSGSSDGLWPARGSGMGPGSSSARRLSCGPSHPLTGLAASAVSCALRTPAAISADLSAVISTNVTVLATRNARSSSFATSATRSPGLSSAAFSAFEFLKNFVLVERLKLNVRPSSSTRMTS